MINDVLTRIFPGPSIPGRSIKQSPYLPYLRFPTEIFDNEKHFLCDSRKNKNFQFFANFRFFQKCAAHLILNLNHMLVTVYESLTV